MKSKNESNYPFAQVILPLSVAGTFTYKIPEEWQGALQIGQRVVVPFGGKKLYTGVIDSFVEEASSHYKIKSIITPLEEFSIVTQSQLQFWHWMSEYYLATLGDVYRNAIPSALKLESESFITKNPEVQVDWELLDEYETLVMQSLENKSSISLKELSAFIPEKKIIQVVKSLYEDQWVNLDEKIIKKYKPKKIDYIRVNQKLENDPILFQKTLDELSKAPKQREFLLHLIQNTQKEPSIQKVPFVKKYIYSNAVLNALVEKDIVQIHERHQDRIQNYNKEVENIEDLTAAQQKAYESIHEQWKTHDVNLLHGVTSSGKTEIYMQLLQEQLDKEKSALLLLPEIGISTQILQRLQKKFGNAIAVYHSKQNSQERVEVYQKILRKQLKIIVGARSSIFLPFQDLGLIIVDEEHETSYKQQDSRPYFNAKDSAIVLAKIQGAKVLLGSATPSLESIYNAEKKKYGYIPLSERYGGVLPPDIHLLNLQHEVLLNGEISPKLEQKMQEVLDKGQQIILFQNRRGYTPMMECLQCGFTPDCPNCDVKLTYHKYKNNLKCHYCNFVSAVPKSCMICQSHDFSLKGLGTQKIEEEVQQKFDNYSIFRMDSDTMRRKHAFEKLFEKFDNGDIQILIGTQMITKGLDFKNVGMVGVIKADALFNIPNFRVEERTYQLLKQVAGRAGRRDKQGEVYIQTYQPHHKVFEALTSDKENLLYKDLLDERQQYQYPPYYRLIEFTFTHTKLDKVSTFSDYFTRALLSFIPTDFVLGPSQPSIGKIRNKYIYHTLVKIPQNISAKYIKERVVELYNKSSQLDGYKSMNIKIVVDPV